MKNSLLDIYADIEYKVGELNSIVNAMQAVLHSNDVKARHKEVIITAMLDSLSKDIDMLKVRMNKAYYLSEIARRQEDEASQEEAGRSAGE